MSDAVYIIDGARTPMGGLMGELSTLSAVNLGEVAIRSALEKSNLSGDDIDEVIMGCVLPSGLRQGPARQAAIDAGDALARFDSRRDESGHGCRRDGEHEQCTLPPAKGARWTENGSRRAARLHVH